MLKKYVSICCIILIILTLSACSEKDPSEMTIEEFSEGYSTISYFVGHSETYYLTFENGVLTIDHNFYKEDSASPSGKSKDYFRSKTYTKNYTLEGKNYITVDGTKYFYNLKSNGDIDFSVDFLGIAKHWNYPLGAK